MKGLNLTVVVIFTVFLFCYSFQLPLQGALRTGKAQPSRKVNQIAHSPFCQCNACSSLLRRNLFGLGKDSSPVSNPGSLGAPPSMEQLTSAMADIQAMFVDAQKKMESTTVTGSDSNGLCEMKFSGICRPLGVTFSEQSTGKSPEALSLAAFEALQVVFKKVEELATSNINGLYGNK